MNQTRKIEIALLIIRLTAAIFMGLWASLKFIRPEWTQNIFQGSYKIEVLLFFLAPISIQFVYVLGVIQIIIVPAFALGLWRTWTYGLMMLMSAAGVLGSLGSYMSYFNYPKNLMLTAIPTLGALIALFILRDLDNLFSLSAKKRSKDSR